MEYCLLVWASLCFSWAAPRHSGAALGVSWALLGALTMFVFFGVFGKRASCFFARASMRHSVILTARCNFCSR